MEFRQIEHFLTLYQVQNMTKASESLFISQQGLSRSIKNLEDELQLELFTKSQLGAIPTAASETLKSFFENLLKDRNLLLSQAEKLQPSFQLQPVKIACGTDFSYSPVASLFRTFSKVFPTVHLDFIPMAEKDRFDALASGKCSFALADVPKLKDEIFSLCTVQREVCQAVVHFSHPLSKHKNFSWKMAQDMDLAVTDPGSLLEKKVRLNLQRTQTKPHYLFTPENSLEIIPKILEEGFIGIMPANNLKFFDKENLVFLPIDPSLYVEIHLISLKTLSRTSSEIQLADYFRHHLHEDVPPSSQD